MIVMTRQLEPTKGGKLAPADYPNESGHEPVSHFKQCHCRCSAGQRIIAILVTAIAVLQTLALAISVQSAPSGYETLADVNTALGSGGRP